MLDHRDQVLVLDQMQMSNNAQKIIDILYELYNFCNHIVPSYIALIEHMENIQLNTIDNTLISVKLNGTILREINDLARDPVNGPILPTLRTMFAICKAIASGLVLIHGITKYPNDLVLWKLYGDAFGLIDEAINAFHSGHDINNEENNE